LKRFSAALLALCLCLPASLFAADDPAADPAPASAGRSSAIKIKPIESPEEGELPQADVGLIDDPTAAVLDYGGYLSQSRFYSNGGILEYVSFGVFSGLNIGASASADGLVGQNTSIYVRDPQPQIKYQFLEGTRRLPSLAVGYDGQGYDYNQAAKVYDDQRRGLYLVGSQELVLPGLEIHPSINFSQFNSRSFFGAIPVSYNIKDKALLMVEWDNINNIVDSRFNAGVRLYLTSHFHLDLAERAIGQSGHFSDGAPRSAERIVQLWYVSSF